MKVQPEHNQHLCHRRNKPSKHCRGIFDQVHVSAGRKREKGRYEKYPELYLVLKLMSHILKVAARKQFPSTKY